MKKLSLFLLVSVFAFCGCSDDDEKMEVVISFENQLTEAESEFKPDLERKEKFISNMKSAIRKR